MAQTFIELLETWHVGILIAHLIGIALGVGGATVSDVLFLKSLKKSKISDFESAALRAISKIIWLGLAILIISGIGLYVPHAEELNQSSKFLAKMVIVAVILINGFALNLAVSPRLKNINESGQWRKVAFALGAISIISWYSALTLGAFESLPFSLPTILAAYGLVLAIGIACSQVVEYRLFKNARS